MQYFNKIYISLLLFSIFFCIISIPIFYANPTNNALSISNSKIFSNCICSSNSDKFIWPIPGYTTISSYFGNRHSPTTYASSFHKGLDIPAPPGTNLYSSISGTIITANFAGSGGCTVTIKNNNTYVSYCHVSPNFLVTIRSNSISRTVNCSSWSKKCIWIF